MLIEKSSMLYWFPKLQKIELPMPKTEFLVIEDLDECDYIETGKLKRDSKTIKNTANKIGYPLFLRTDLASGKHRWNETCYVPDEKSLLFHVSQVLESNALSGIMGLPCKALAFREYIPMNSFFTAFHGMPINPERRYFVKDGEVICKHHYWIKESISETSYHKPPLPSDWENKLEQVNKMGDEIELLTTLAHKSSETLDGAWSIDFCQAENKKWWLIDCAQAKASWHPEDCPWYHELYEKNPLKRTDRIEV